MPAYKDEKQGTYLLRTMGISEYSIYTVKAVKGLEFREVVVFDRDMSASLPSFAAGLPDGVHSMMTIPAAHRCKSAHPRPLLAAAASP